jgi:hypothetical protein
MLVFIWLFPVIAFCTTVLLIDLARAMKKAGNKIWIVLMAIAVLLTAAAILWFVYRGDLHAQRWAKEWAHR